MVRVKPTSIPDSNTLTSEADIKNTSQNFNIKSSLKSPIDASLSNDTIQILNSSTNSLKSLSANKNQIQKTFSSHVNPHPYPLYSTDILSLSNAQILSSLSKNGQDIPIRPFSSLLLEPPDSPDVAGMKGRHKLQKDSDISSADPLLIRNGKWCDIKRKYLAAYEYLCHVAEAKEWMESCLGYELRPIEELEESLRDGVDLANLAKTFCPEAVGRIYSGRRSSRFKSRRKSKKLNFKHTDNINYFQNALKKIGLPKLFYFELTDLYNAKNIPRVIYCIHSLSHFLESLGITVGIKDLVGVLEFTPEQLEQTQLKLNNLGPTNMVQFKGLNRRISSQSDSANINSTTPAQTTDSNSDANSDSGASTLNSKGSKSLQKIETRSVQSLEFVDDIPTDITRYWEQNIDTLIKIQLAAKRYLAVRDVIEKRQIKYYLEVVHSTKLIQTLIRGYFARKFYKTLQEKNKQIQPKETFISNSSASSTFNPDTDNQEDEVVSILSENIVTNDEKPSLEKEVFLNEPESQDKNDEIEFEKKVIIVQALIRGYLARKLFSDMDAWTTLIKKIQAHCRGFLTRSEFKDKLAHWKKVNQDIKVVQALARGKLVRNKFKSNDKHYERNIKVIVKMQNILKAKIARRAYRTLTIEDSIPTPKIVRSCAPLLEETDQDLAEELELEKLRQKVVRQIRDNQHTEQSLKGLDIKIALLVRNKVSLEEVIKHTKSFLSFFSEIRNPSFINNPAFRSNVSNFSMSGAAPPGSLYSLRNLSRDSRRRLESYQHLLYLLQTQPLYLSRLLLHQKEQFNTNGYTTSTNNFAGNYQGTTTRLVENKGVSTSNKNEILSDSTIMAMFGYSQNSREEFLFLKLIQAIMDMEVDKMDSLLDSMDTEFIFLRLSNLHNKGDEETTYLCNTFKPVLLKMFENTSLDLESDPLVIYRTFIRENEAKTGMKSNKPYNISRDDALNDPEVRPIFIQRLLQLRLLADEFLNAIMSTLDTLPYAIRFLARELKSLLITKFPNVHEKNILKVVGSTIYLNYFNHAIVSPDKHGVVDTPINTLQRSNLSQVSKILTQVASGTAFSDDDLFLQPLNNYVNFTAAKFTEYNYSLASVASLETHFHIDEFTDLVSIHKPTLYLTIEDIMNIHNTILQNIKIIAPSTSESQEVFSGEEALKSWLRRTARKSGLRKYSSMYFGESDAVLPLKSIASMSNLNENLEELVDVLPPGTVLVEKNDDTNRDNHVLVLDDPLNVILRELGNPPRIHRDPYARSMIMLNLADRFADDSMAFLSNTQGANQLSLVSNSSKLINSSLMNIGLNEYDEKSLGDSSSLHTLFLTTKRIWVAILRVKSGSSLLDILNSPSTAEDEARWRYVVEDENTKLDERKKRQQELWSSQQRAQQLLQSTIQTLGFSSSPKEALRQIPDIPKSVPPIPGEETISSWKKLSFEQIKSIVRSSMNVLEKNRFTERPRRSGIGATNRKNSTRNSIGFNSGFKIRSSDKYQGMLNAIVKDLKNKNGRREQRHAELRRVRQNLVSLGIKTQYLDSQREFYEKYLDSCIQQLTLSNNQKTSGQTLGKRLSRTGSFIMKSIKSKLPLSKNIFNEKTNVESKQNSKFGQYKYNAEKLYLKGVLVSVEGYSPRQLDKVGFSISCDEPGVFEIGITYMGSEIVYETSQIKLEDLLQKQYDNQTIFTLFNDTVKFNVNLLVYLINKKFFI
ncbi:hypothetical protein BB558_005524 [Smittium angustum]|uniref:Ras-GAP domain-containing protein n=1 Tax=Smittium angustum TaxID=133377 RepID=A0A2U1J079_SMIAN|nr:hypothetical protein BB558_005524 [Smittium angustum]